MHQERMETMKPVLSEKEKQALIKILKMKPLFSIS